MIVPVKTYLKVWAALLGLLALTVGVSFLQLGRLNLPIAMLIAVAKASLIVLVFMHIKGGSRLLHLAAAAGLLWLAIMFVLTMNDYFTRDAVAWLTR
jgi:cytochrome c oxidase subunit 4